MAPDATGRPRGILYPRSSETKYRLVHLPPPAGLAPFVERFWIVRWSLERENSHLQQNLPHPCIHLVFEGERSRVVGVPEGRFTRRLEGEGKIVGVKFRPGGFHPFWRRPVSQLTGEIVPFTKFFGASGDGVETAVLEPASDERMTERATAFLLSLRPVRDPVAEEAAEIVERIAADRALTRVAAVARATGSSVRRLERVFERYVGVGPKWVVQRHRLHEALEKIDRGSAAPDWAELAAELGWSDQAHFIRDFKRLVGRSPAAYRRHASTLTRLPAASTGSRQANE
jgi:AraC-like DNA-binding protein